MSILERITALLAPDDCLGCRREGSLLCTNCIASRPQSPASCSFCYRPTGAAICAACLRRMPFVNLQAATVYNGVSKRLVGQLKFAHNRAAAALMARLLYERCEYADGALLSYVPAGVARVRERGFDQSELVVRELSRLTGLPWCRLLARTGGQHQLGSSRAERHRQLTGVLRAVHRDRILRQNVILVDDVLTTGSSLLASAQVLLRAGAQSVSAVAFAQAYEERSPGSSDSVKR